MEPGTFPDSVKTAVLDKPACVLGLYEEEEVDQEVDIIVNVFARLGRWHRQRCLPTGRGAARRRHPAGP